MLTFLACTDVPRDLRRSITVIWIRTSSKFNNEAYSRTVIDQLLICCLYEESLMSIQNPTSSAVDHAHPAQPASGTSTQPEWLHGTLLLRVVTHKGERKTLSGFADYSLWYDKRNPMVFSAASDGHEF
jgi:hypothetical protein